ncbi:DUF2793 domain-containing protein [Amaricoccus sp.]|uniref:DUF2793 domain-containing protein n=1 Tax=Amaricoccus sp. TaxID=1872485 RepID=UPI001B5EE966|nr:DUF2793 domain-containing protein [Amaricoccus sp.]MBP7000695.1 DUF2793 domain-containing protein [Amaricoccus sp.]
MDTSPNLSLSFLAPAQAQKHVTVNETFFELDSLVQCSVLAMNVATPPAGAVDGQRYHVGASPTGAWSGRAGSIASWRNGGWAYSVPKAGWRVYDVATDRLLVRNAAGAWIAVGGAPTELQNVTRLGIGAAADAATPFVAKLNDALWNARATTEGGTGSLRLSLNRQAADKDAGFALQTNFVTRAVAGLFGSSRFRVSVSADGATFRDALSVDDATAIVDQPRLPRFKASTNFDNYVALDTWTKIAVNTAESNDQAAFDPATNRFRAPVAGFYALGATLLHRINSSTNAKMRGRLVKNGTTEIPGSMGEISGAHVTLATALWIQTVAPLAKDDTVELQGFYRGADGYFAANHTSFWGYKVG